MQMKTDNSTTVVASRNQAHHGADEDEGSRGGLRGGEGAATANGGGGDAGVVGTEDPAHETRESMRSTPLQPPSQSTHARKYIGWFVMETFSKRTLSMPVSEVTRDPTMGAPDPDGVPDDAWVVTVNTTAAGGPVGAAPASSYIRRDSRVHVVPWSLVTYRETFCPCDRWTSVAVASARQVDRSTRVSRMASPVPS